MTHANGATRALNLAAQDRMRAAGVPGVEGRLIIERAPCDFATGDRVRFPQNDRGVGVKHGTPGPVDAVHRQAKTVGSDAAHVVRFDASEGERIDPAIRQRSATRDAGRSTAPMCRPRRAACWHDAGRLPPVFAVDGHARVGEQPVGVIAEPVTHEIHRVGQELAHRHAAWVGEQPSAGRYPGAEAEEEHLARGGVGQQRDHGLVAPGQQHHRARVREQRAESQGFEAGRSGGGRLCENHDRRYDITSPWARGLHARSLATRLRLRA